jgi:DNA-binding NtrC family response regulator
MLSRLRVPASVVIGVAAALVAFGLSAIGGGAAVEGWAQARWRRAAPTADGILLVTTGPGAGADPALLARLVSRLSRAGASAVAVDGKFGSAAGTTAASEAVWRQVLSESGHVVVGLTPGAPDASSARAVGHMVAEPAGGLLAVPALAGDDPRVAALGIAVVSVAKGAAAVVQPGAVAFAGSALRLPLDRRGRALLSPSGALPAMTLGEVLRLIDRDDAGELQARVGGRIVFLSSAGSTAMRTQAELANAVLTGTALLPAAPGWPLLGAVIVAIGAAWSWLTRRWFAALLDAVGLVLVGVGAVGLLFMIGIVMPVTPFLAAVPLASAGALSWRHVRLRGRLGALEAELTSLREALVRQESTVEILEEDLEAARAAVERSAGSERELLRVAEALRAEVGAARAQEAQTRRRLAELDAQSRPAAAPAEADGVAARLGILTRDPAMLALVRDLGRAAPSTLPILITGEAGTGKELFARAAHRLSPRAARPFVAVNMAAIPPELFESELFGHVRGSFTGAVADRRGWLEQADGGTIFLDEIGDLRPDHQSKLLRALQEKSFYRVGAVRPTSVDVRVVAASNRDLERGIRDGWFREDLYFRLKGLVVRLPALRERRGDIPLLAARILADAAAEAKRPAPGLSEPALAALMRHDWPGNVRELQNCLRQAVALAQGPVIAEAELRLEAVARVTGGAADDGDASVLATLRQHRFDMQATARALGWDRSTVTQRLKGLAFRALVDASGDAVGAAAALAGDPALARTVELKLCEYHEHLLRTVAAFDSADAAVAACRRRFKNLPERHFPALESLVRRHFERARA